MKPLWIALVLVACAGSQPPSQPSDIQAGSISPSSLLQRVGPAIVQVEVGKSSIGLGFVVDKAGIIATNLHTVAGEAAILVRLSDGARYPVTQILGFDVARDLVLLRIQPSRELPALMLGNSRALSAGNRVIAIGKPGPFLFNSLIWQIRPVCTPKDIAAGRCKQELTILAIALPDGSISNGPLFDQRGEVVGIVAALVPGKNLGIAVPCDYLKPLLAQRAAMALEQFARSTEEYAGSTGSARGRDVDRNVPIVRHVPSHDVAIFDGCKSDDIAAIVQHIDEAIRSGAPLYNAGNREGCFRVYEGTALKIQREVPCAGVRSAFESSIQQSSSLGTYGEKAWALRDAFDGMLDAAKRWHDRRPQAAPPAQP